MAEPRPAELKYLVERQREELKTLNEVGRLLSSTTAPQEIARLVASYLRQTFPLALCGVLGVEQRKLLVIQFAKIAQVDIAAAVREICQRASEHLQRPLSEEDLARTFEDQSPGAGQWALAPIGYLRSNHFAPLRFNGQVTGLLSVFSGKAEAFTKEDRHVIDIVADQLGAALRNAFLLDELKRAGQLKNDLLMIISHELRTPLTSIQEGVHLIVEGAVGPTTAEQQDLLKTVGEETDRLGRLVEKVLLATQLVTGELQWTFGDVNVDTLVKELESTVRPLAQARGVRLEVSGVAPTLTCVGDGKRLKQALGNLVENAIQATRAEGQVRVTCSATPAGLDFQVTDTGAGIPPEDLPKLFERFHFTGGVDDRKTGGLGLGLFITNAIIEAHRGTTRLESQVGQGTRVSVRLPQKPG
ncbi:MAG: GAF domain-containing protein [Candidatus Omnitrophica bacterium]|nr:GAF domain-containing protein [Candidatus Omnitrophota bacterium]